MLMSKRECTFERCTGHLANAFIWKNSCPTCNCDAPVVVGECMGVLECELGTATIPFSSPSSHRTRTKMTNLTLYTTTAGKSIKKRRSRQSSETDLLIDHRLQYSCSTLMETVCWQSIINLLMRLRPLRQRMALQRQHRSRTVINPLS